MATNCARFTNHKGDDTIVDGDDAFAQFLRGRHTSLNMKRVEEGVGDGDGGEKEEEVAKANLGGGQNSAVEDRKEDEGGDDCVNPALRILMEPPCCIVDERNVDGLSWGRYNVDDEWSEIQRLFRVHGFHASANDCFVSVRI